MARQTQINTALLKQTLAHIEANPLTWEQTSFRCGTGMCFAGWAAQLSGCTWLTNDPDDMYGDFVIAEPDDEQVSDEVDGKQVIGVRFRAARVLGIDLDRAEELFEAHNELDDLRDLVTELCAEAES